MKHKKYNRTALIIGIFLVLGANAHAQFMGDVFFENPSIIVPKGQVKDIELSIFAGDRPFGAALTQLRFDPKKLEVVKIEPLATSDVLPVLKQETSEGNITIAVVNGTVLDKPIGGVVLARISVRAIGETSDQTIITTAVTSAYSADRKPYPQGDGWSAEISIGSEDAEATAAALFSGTVDAALRARALKLRPAGARIKLYSRSGAGTFREVIVPTSDPNAVRESPASAQDR
jgi:hypothetical protein